jgi:hypothetical protein
LAATFATGLAAGLAAAFVADGAGFADAFTEVPALAADFVAGAAFAEAFATTFPDAFEGARADGFAAAGAAFAAFAGLALAADAAPFAGPDALTVVLRVALEVAAWLWVVVRALLTTGPRWVDRENL